MVLRSFEERRRLESLPGDALRTWQLSRLNDLLQRVLPANRFYAEKLAGCRLPLHSLEQLAELPYTFKEELLGKGAGHAGHGRNRHGSGAAPHGEAASDAAANLTFPRERYVRFHQTSGTRGRPLVVLDTAEDWHQWCNCWQHVFDAGEVTEADTVLFAFSFGPYIGFWSALDAAAARGCLIVPAGGMNTTARLELLRHSGASVVCCTPSYALHLAETARERTWEPQSFGVRTFILAGEPGGSIAGVRRSIEQAWNARVVDHAGATEVGPWGFGDDVGEGLYVLESDFIAEFLSVETGGPARDGELAELVLTTLSRVGAPVIRYRTGDLVRPRRDHRLPRRFVFLDGGVIGRNDDMLIIRGVNIFPSAIDHILRSFPEVMEYRATARSHGAMDALDVEIEDRLDQPRRVADELRLRLGLKIDVRTVPLGSLPRFEGKGCRVIDERPSDRRRIRAE